MIRHVGAALVVAGLFVSLSTQVSACDGRGGGGRPTPGGGSSGGSVGSGGSLASSGRLFTSPGSWMYMVTQNQQRQAAYNQAYQLQQTAILAVKTAKKERQLETQKALRVAELAKREQAIEKNREQQYLKQQQQSLAYSVSMRSSNR